MDRSPASGGTYRTSAAPRALESTCLLCGSDGEADSACSNCAVSMPRLTCACGAVNSVAALRCRACSTQLGASPARPRVCPRCLSYLREVAVDPTANVHACTACRGVFVPARAWHLLSSRDDLARALASRLPESAPPSSPQPRLFACPECTREMDRMRFAATSQFVVDVCNRQDGLWIAGGELAPALAYAKHRRAIGADAAAREADALERARPSGDPNRRLHEAALAMARERQERATHGTFAAPDAPPRKRRYTLIAVLGVMALFYVSLSAKDCSKHSRARRSDAPDTNVKALRSGKWP